MRFYEELAEQLAEAEVRLEAEARARAEGERSRRRTKAPDARPARRSGSRRWARPVALAAVAAAVAGIAITSFGPEGRVSEAIADLPIFTTPPVDMTGEIRVPEPERAYAQIDRSHRFDTPQGEGYVFRGGTKGAPRICVAVPDDTDGFGVSCGSRERTEARGQFSTLIPSGRGEALVVLLLPEGARGATFRREDGGPVTTYRGIRGVVAFEPDGNGVLTWRGPAGVQREEILERFVDVEPNFRVECRAAENSYFLVERRADAEEQCRPNGGVASVRPVRPGEFGTPRRR